MTDVLLRHTADGGDVLFADAGFISDLQTEAGLETAAYLSMWGGNMLDPGLPVTGDPDGPHRKQWWGNLGEPPENRQRSRTQYLLRSIPPTSNNLLRIERAAEGDLAWMVDTGLATNATASASLVERNRIRIRVDIAVRDVKYTFDFYDDWGIGA